MRIDINRWRNAHKPPREQSQAHHRRPRWRVARQGAGAAGIGETSALVKEAPTALVERESARRLALLGAREPALSDVPRRRMEPAWSSSTPRSGSITGGDRSFPSATCARSASLPPVGSRASPSLPGMSCRTPRRRARTPRNTKQRGERVVYPCRLAMGWVQEV